MGSHSITTFLTELILSFVEKKKFLDNPKATEKLESMKLHYYRKFKPSWKDYVDRVISRSKMETILKEMHSEIQMLSLLSMSTQQRNDLNVYRTSYEQIEKLFYDEKFDANKYR